MYQERKRRQTETRGEWHLQSALLHWINRPIYLHQQSPLWTLDIILSILETRQATHHTVKSGPDTESPTLEWLDAILIRRAVTLVCVVIIPFHAEAQLQFYRIFNKC